MKYLAGFILCLLAMRSAAQLGESPEELQKRYGGGKKARRAGRPFDAVYYYTLEKQKVKAGLVDGKCVHLVFRANMRGRTLTDDETGAILTANVSDTAVDEPWAAIDPPVSADPSLRRGTRLKNAWVRSDKKAFAWASIVEFAIFSQAYLDACEKAKERARREKEFARLQRTVRGRDFDAALKAVQDIAKLGPEFVSRLPELVKELMKHNRKAIMAELKRGAKRNAKQEAELAELRSLALKNIAALDKEDDDTLKDASKYYKDLRRDMKTLKHKLASRNKVLKKIKDDLEKHRRLTRIMNQLETGDKKFTDVEAEAELTELTKAVFGATPEEVRALHGPEGQAPNNPVLAELWRYNLNRAIEAYNQTQHRARVSSKGEYANLVMVNDYRETLGLRRLELDARLVQSARKHSKEMRDLGYFSHESPTPERKTFSQRIKQTGYPAPGGENIAMGKSGGESVFWMWFYSPGHHQNMVRARFTAVGVGQWKDHYTQNFGSGEILVFANEKMRAEARPKGELLRP